MFVIVVIFFFSIISFGISFVATCAYLLLLVVHLQEFPLYFQPSVRSFETTVSVPLSFVILLKTDNSFNFSVCIFMFQPSNHLDDFLLYSFQNTYIFLEVEKSIQNTPDTSLWQWGSIFLRRELEGNNHFFDLLLDTLLEEMFSLCCLVVVIMESPQKLWVIEGIFSSFACYKAGFVTFQQLNHFVKVTCFIKIKPWDEHWEVSKHQLLMVFW